MKVILEGKQIELYEGLTEEGKFFYVFHRITKDNKNYNVSVVVSPAKPTKTISKPEQPTNQPITTQSNQKPPSALNDMSKRYENMPENFKLF